MQRLIGELKKESRKCKFLSAGVSAHRANCDNFSGFPPEEIYDISWSASRIKRDRKTSIFPLPLSIITLYYATTTTIILYLTCHRVIVRNCGGYLDEGGGGKRPLSIGPLSEGVNSVGRRVYDFVRVDCWKKRSEAKGDFSLDVTLNDSLGNVALKMSRWYTGSLLIPEARRSRGVSPSF